MKISSDSTIETVWPSLTHQKNYVSGALQKMRQCNATHDNASIKIGITGTGQKPYYRVSYSTVGGEERIFGSFYDNHEPLESGFVETSNWSSRSMSFQEVLEFYSKAIGYTGTKA